MDVAFDVALDVALALDGDVALNSLHWVLDVALDVAFDDVALDVAFDEDRCRVRTGHAGQNLAVARHWVLNLLKQERTAKVGIKAKRKKAVWDYPYLLKVLSP